MADTADNLEDLLVRVAADDRQAFRELYTRSANVVFAVLLNILPRRDLAEEALQDVYMRVWRQAASYRAARGKPLTWLTSIARNRALDIKRRLGREAALPQSLAEAESQPADVDSDPALAAQWGDDAKQLARCMAGLSNDQNRSIRLAFLRGFSHSEVATQIGAPVGTVKSWIRRGLAALKRCLGQ
ncbi:MAG: sigma-70 family RNA polymerase sigma factor [Pseudomonadota bacterium]